MGLCALFGAIGFFILWLASGDSRKVKFETMYFQWKRTKKYIDLNGKSREDVDGLIDAWFKLQKPKQEPHYVGQLATRSEKVGG